MAFGFQVVLQQGQFLFVAGGVQLAAHQLEAQVDQPGVEHIGLAVITNTLEVAFLEGVEHLAAAHAHLAGEAQQGGDLVQRGVGPGVEQGQLVHQVQVALVVTAQVIVPFEAGVFVTGFPVTAGLHTMLEGTVMQHRQIEAATVPAHQIGGEAVDAIVEPFDQLFFTAVLVAQGPDLDALGGAQHHRDGNDTMQVQAQEFGAVFLAAQIQQGTGGVLVTEAIQIVNAASAVQIGDGFDVEYQYVHSALRCSCFPIEGSSVGSDARIGKDVRQRPSSRCKHRFPQKIHASGSFRLPETPRWTGNGRHGRR